MLESARVCGLASHRATIALVQNNTGSCPCLSSSRAVRSSIVSQGLLLSVVCTSGAVSVSIADRRKRLIRSGGDVCSSSVQRSAFPAVQLGRRRRNQVTAEYSAARAASVRSNNIQPRIACFEMRQYGHEEFTGDSLLQKLVRNNNPAPRGWCGHGRWDNAYDVARRLACGDRQRRVLVVGFEAGHAASCWALWGHRITAVDGNSHPHGDAAETILRKHAASLPERDRAPTCWRSVVGPRNVRKWVEGLPGRFAAVHVAPDTLVNADLDPTAHLRRVLQACRGKLAPDGCMCVEDTDRTEVRASIESLGLLPMNSELPSPTEHQAWVRAPSRPPPVPACKRIPKLPGPADTTNVKVIDATLFNFELPLWRARRRWLDPVVDLFIVEESTRRFTTTVPKTRLLLQEELEARPDDKVVRVKCTPEDDLVGWPAQAFVRGHLGREAVRAAHERFGPDAELLFLTSDLDEIPSHEAIERAKQQREGVPIRFPQHHYHYDLHRSRWATWSGTVAIRTRAAVAADHFQLQTIYKHRTEPVAVGPPGSGGWHLAWFGGPRALSAKLVQSSHLEIDDASRHRSEYIAQILEEGRVLNMPHAKMALVSASETGLPTILLGTDTAMRAHVERFPGCCGVPGANEEDDPKLEDASASRDEARA